MVPLLSVIFSKILSALFAGRQDLCTYYFQSSRLHIHHNLIKNRIGNPETVMNSILNC